MKIQRNAASWRDTTYEAIWDIFTSANEQQHIYKRIRRLFGGNTHFRKMTNLGFFRLLSKIFQGRCSKPLPQDLVHEIVSRLTAEDVLKCIMVCKGWMDVILTPHFYDLHKSRAPPLILLQNFDRTRDLKLYSLDLTHEEPCIRRFDNTEMSDFPCHLVGTFDGLLLLHTVRQDSNGALHAWLSIYNPLTERVLGRTTVQGTHCCGFWFHPIKREYLFLTTSSFRYEVGGFCYKIFNMKGESTVLGWYDTIPSLDVPINIGHSLYYMIQKSIGRPRNCIMIFNTETETVDFKSHPHSSHCDRGHVGYGLQNEDMRLLEIDGSLAFAHVCSDTKCLYLWILVDCSTWHWIERYKINLNWCYGRKISFSLHPLSVQKGEMLIFYRPDNRLIAFNLETRRVRNIDLHIVYVEAAQIVVSTIYRSSFVGLKRMAHIITSRAN